MDCVKECTKCLLCRFTRNASKDGFLYRVARKLQKKCPVCGKANETLKKDFQKSASIEE